MPKNEFQIMHVGADGVTRMIAKASSKRFACLLEAARGIGYPTENLTLLNVGNASNFVAIDQSNGARFYFR